VVINVFNKNRFLAIHDCAKEKPNNGEGNSGFSLHEIFYYVPTDKRNHHGLLSLVLESHCFYGRSLPA
jgi:hypothetical protein